MVLKESGLLPIKYNPNWSVVYERAIRDDGSLLFPERLTHDFLEEQRRTMGSYLFANQYQNEVIPDDEKVFKAQWYRLWASLPKTSYRFAFVDPAIGQAKHNDYTGITVIEADPDGFWYVRLAARYRLTPTEIISKLFDLHAEYKLQVIGIEVVAYQEALLYILDQEMRRRGQILPVKGVARGAQSKQTRILGLVPRFEWGRIMMAPGQTDFEDEYASFPRGSHDDILDSLASLEELVYYPQKESTSLEKPQSPADPRYEQWYIANLSKRAARSSSDDE